MGSGATHWAGKPKGPTEIGLEAVSPNDQTEHKPSAQAMLLRNTEWWGIVARKAPGILALDRCTSARFKSLEGRSRSHKCKGVFHNDKALTDSWFPEWWHHLDVSAGYFHMLLVHQGPTSIFCRHGCDAQMKGTLILILSPWLYFPKYFIFWRLTLASNVSWQRNYVLCGLVLCGKILVASALKIIANTISCPKCKVRLAML